MTANSKEYDLAYYYTNMSIKYTCECGCILTKSKKYRHILTKRHLKKIDEINVESEKGLKRISYDNIYI